MQFQDMFSCSMKVSYIMALLTMKVEYIAATHTAKEAMWLYMFIGEVFDSIDKATTLFYNNQSAITFSQNGKFHAHTKTFTSNTISFATSLKTAPSTSSMV